MIKLNIFILFAVFIASCGGSKKVEQREVSLIPALEEEELPPYTLEATDTFAIPKAELLPIIDGSDNDPCWENKPWRALDKVWLGVEPDKKDFTGRYKLCWGENELFLLVSIEDDSLIDIYSNPLDNWWNDDCLEIFIDENNGDDLHQFNHKAFAYHVGLNNDVVDLGPDEKPHLYNDHIRCKRVTKDHKSIWELAVSVYDDSYDDNIKENKKVTLSTEKVMGFALAYCDNDSSVERENFIGSILVHGEDKDQGWKDAGIFNTIILKE